MHLFKNVLAHSTISFGRLLPVFFLLVPPVLPLLIYKYLVACFSEVAAPVRKDANERSRGEMRAALAGATEKI